MISLRHLNKIIILITFFIAITLNYTIAEEGEAVDIWKKKENQSDQSNQNSSKENLTIESPILSEDVNKIVIKISEDEIDDNNQSVIGIFDPEENNFNLNMWRKTDGEEIKKVLKRINKLKLSKLSENLLFQVLFTNAYPPQKNLDAEEFLKIKINWLIRKKRSNFD